ncbi:MAG: hypothetical protein L3J71_16625 [Victivallaceae bacterium]|nr:hypothetical protein [Victivallaceae bacterium]
MKSVKLSDEAIEDNLSKQFETLPVSNSIQIKKHTDYKVNFHQTLELAARVLKNCENIKSPSIINNYLAELVKMSSKYGIFIHSIFLQQYKEGNTSHFPIPKNVVLVIAPLINQLMLLTWLGTDFMELPLRKHLEKLLKDDPISEYELYLVSFLYTDMHFKENLTYLKEVASKIKNPYIAELCFMKVFLYYMMRPSNSPKLIELESLMKKLIIKAGSLNKGKATQAINDMYKKAKSQNLFE